MKSKTGREMRNLIIAVSLINIVLVMAIIAFFMVDIIVTYNRNIEHNKEKMIQQSVLFLNQMTKNVTDIGSNAELVKYFDPELTTKVLSGDASQFYRMMVDIALGLYPVDYVGIIRDGKVVEYGTKKGLVVDPEKMPVNPPEGDYSTLDSLDSKKGFFVSAFFATNLNMYGLGTLQGNVIVDRTAELADIETYFKEQRNNLILGMSIVAIITLILTILLTTLGLRYFTVKYVVRPIEELNRTAEEIAEGTFQGEVKVDKDSAYAALQGLLQSGQKVLRKMDKELGNRQE